MAADGMKPGLRDRKRAQTWIRIETAAVDLVLRDGFEATTVDAISERADISPRTFFNYFESKDAAVLGVRPHQADEEVLAELLAIAGDLDPVPAVVHLVMATMGVAETVDVGLHARRLEIFRRHPEIVGGQFAQLNARKDRMAEYATRILSRRSPLHDDTGPGPGPDDRAQGDIVLAMCASAVRFAVLDWATNTDSTGHERSGLGTGDVEVIGQRAVALVHRTLARLA
jgi:AcrR family transcriptional regulator